MENINNLQARISKALEDELLKVYEEKGVMSGDISPEQSLLWDDLTAEMAKLFEILADQNKEG
jgi:hypothetical protein